MLRSVSLLLLVLTATLSEGEARAYTNSWAVAVEGGAEAADQLAAKYGFTNLGLVSPDLLKDMYHFVMPEHTLLGKRSLSGLPVYHLSQALESESNVGYVKQQELKKMVKKGYSVPSDPQWNNQWQLLNNGQLPAASGGRDLNVERAWLQGITGCGSVVAIVDDGVEYTHSDLRANYDSSIQADVVDSDGNPFPIIDSNGARESHGTNCAGEIAMAKSNSHCGVGVAYNSQITAIRLLGLGQTDITEASALGHMTDKIQISSNSWGPFDDGRVGEQPGELLSQVLETAARTGRQGKGTIFLFAAGNGGEMGDSCAADGYSSSIYTIGIGAANSNGEQTPYDEQCAGKMAMTFVDSTTQELLVTTTSVEDTCISNFDGTSAATPLASGIVALMLEANDDLTWRDIQYLIAYTSNRDILVNGDWFTNGATPSLRVSHKFGFGALDAEALVTRARNWISVPEQQIHTTVPSTSTGLVPGPNDPLVVSQMYSSDIGFLEHVVVELTLSFPDVEYYYYYDYYDTTESLDNGAYRGNIQVELTSPSGTNSIILPYRLPDVTSNAYSNFRFSSVHFWGENPNGVWNLTVLNRNNFENATVEVTIHGITFYGIDNTPEAVSRIPTQCHESCDSNRGCAASGAQYCDACANLRNAMTRECIDSCPQNFIQRNGYCYGDNIPEVACVLDGTVVLSSFTMLTIFMGLLSLWLGSI